CQAASDSSVNSCVRTVEAFWCAFACDESMVAWIDVACDQISCICIRTGDDEGRPAEYIRCQSGCSQVSYCILSWKQYFASQMSAFFLGSQLIFKVDACSSCFDHRFHQFVDIQRSAKAGLCICYDWCEPVKAFCAFNAIDLI